MENVAICVLFFLGCLALITIFFFVVAKLNDPESKIKGAE